MNGGEFSRKKLGEHIVGKKSKKNNDGKTKGNDVGTGSDTDDSENSKDSEDAGGSIRNLIAMHNTQHKDINEKKDISKSKNEFNFDDPEISEILAGGESYDDLDLYDDIDSSDRSKMKKVDFSDGDVLDATEKSERVELFIEQSKSLIRDIIKDIDFETGLSENGESSPLYQHAVKSILAAAKSYDPKKVSKLGKTSDFSTYAYSAIKNNLRHYQIKKMGLTDYAIKQKQIIKNAAQKLVDEYNKDNNKNMTGGEYVYDRPEKIADILNMTKGTKQSWTGQEVKDFVSNINSKKEEYDMSKLDTIDNEGHGHSYEKNIADDSNEEEKMQHLRDAGKSFVALDQKINRGLKNEEEAILNPEEKEIWNTGALEAPVLQGSINKQLKESIANKLNRDNNFTSKLYDKMLSIRLKIIKNSEFLDHQKNIDNAHNKYPGIFANSSSYLNDAKISHNKQEIRKLANKLGVEESDINKMLDTYKKPKLLQEMDRIKYGDSFYLTSNQNVQKPESLLDLYKQFSSAFKDKKIKSLIRDRRRNIGSISDDELNFIKQDIIKNNPNLSPDYDIMSGEKNPDMILNDMFDELSNKLYDVNDGSNEEDSDLILNEPKMEDPNKKSKKIVIGSRNKENKDE